MTIFEIEDAPNEVEVIQNRTLICSWCGEVVRFDGDELALAMCQTCYKRMHDELIGGQKTDQPSPHSSDR